MSPGLTVLLAVHMQRAALEVDLIPTDCHEFTYAQPVPERYEDQHRVARSMPPRLGGRGDQSLDLGRGEMLVAAAFQVGHATRRRDFPIFDGRKTALAILECQYCAHRLTPIFLMKRR